MTTVLIKDDFGIPIPVLRPAVGSGKAQTIAVIATSARNSVALTASVISVYASGPCFVAIGDVTVAATTSDHYIAAGERRDISMVSGDAPRGQILNAPPGSVHTHIAAIRSGADCTLYISELE